ncbi:hypothetical protein PGTUg99_028643 [Puccinia graminis f. sp. tritici]|uniref:Uncharacterized protein n=1 Tax=Puccinia graminis f. sp. tritici TaxID=56615 RepID=A0A5B0RF85_PUCGR|nr:hypothetical protein PGTUg99_028643 [Puccinia graminis f. sp. tritici]
MNLRFVVSLCTVLNALGVDPKKVSEGSLEMVRTRHAGLLSTARIDPQERDHTRRV